MSGASSADGPDAEPGGRDDLGLRVLGALVAVAGALVTAVIEVFLTPLRISTVRLPLSLLLAVAGNLALVWFTFRVTEKLSVVALPALVWVVVMLRASAPTTAGDLLITGNNWVGILTIFAGAVAFAVGTFSIALPRRQTPPRRT